MEEVVPVRFAYLVSATHARLMEGGGRRRKKKGGKGEGGRGRGTHEASCDTFMNEDSAENVEADAGRE